MFSRLGQGSIENRTSGIWKGLIGKFFLWSWQCHDIGIARGSGEGLYWPCRDVIQLWHSGRGKLSKFLHLKTREAVSNVIAYTSDMDNTYIDVVTTCTKV